MGKLADFLDKYDTIIFDMDGVITSEENYWNCAAVTVYEIFNSSDYIGHSKIDVNYIMENCADMRRYLFKNDNLISVLKDKGVNSNWDLTYVVICISTILQTPYPDEIYRYALKLGDNINNDYNTLAMKAANAVGSDYELFERNGHIWNLAHMCFQEWFLGDALFRKVYGRLPVKPGKPGFVNEEQPIVSREILKQVLLNLQKSGKKLCIGTGRPSDEIIPPLENWGIKQYFSENNIINYDYVAAVEEKHKGKSFAKPHPYMFLKAMLGNDFSDDDIIKGKYPKEPIQHTLVIGDAGADIFAARAMGADFCAVLTGVKGRQTKFFFEEQDAEYILDSVLDLMLP